MNLPSVEMVDVVDRFALTIGKKPVPKYKARMVYKFESDKFRLARLTPEASHTVKPPKAKQCPIQLEAQVENIYSLGRSEDHLCTVELSILKTHVTKYLLNSDKRHHIDPDKWRPLIMNFLEFYGLGDQVHPSRLAKVF